MVEDPDTAAEKFMLETMVEMLDHLPEHTRIAWLPNQDLIVSLQAKRYKKVTLKINHHSEFIHVNVRLAFH